MTDRIDQRIASRCAFKWSERGGIYRLPCDDVAVAEIIARTKAPAVAINLWAARLFLSCRPGEARIDDLLASDRVHVSGARNPVTLAAADLYTIERGASDGDRLLRRLAHLSRPNGLAFTHAVDWINNVLSGNSNRIMFALGRPMTEWNRAHEAAK